MKYFLFGFISCLSLFLFIGASSQIGNKFDETGLYNELTQMRKELNDNKFMVLRSTPLASTLVEGQGVLVSSGTKSIVFRIDSATYSVTLNKL